MNIGKWQLHHLLRAWIKYAFGGICYLLCLYLAIAFWWYRPGQISYFEALVAFSSPQSTQDFLIIGALTIYSMYAATVLMLLLSHAKARSIMTRSTIFFLLLALALWVHFWGVVYWKQTLAASIWLYLLVMPILSSTLLFLLCLHNLFFLRARVRKI
jgi:hypothetical protein